MSEDHDVTIIAINASELFTGLEAEILDSALSRLLPRMQDDFPQAKFLVIAELPGDLIQYSTMTDKAEHQAFLRRALEQTEQLDGELVRGQE